MEEPHTSCDLAPGNFCSHPRRENRKSATDFLLFKSLFLKTYFSVFPFLSFLFFLAQEVLKILRKTSFVSGVPQLVVMFYDLCGDKQEVAWWELTFICRPDGGPGFNLSENVWCCASWGHLHQVGGPYITCPIWHERSLTADYSTVDVNQKYRLYRQRFKCDVDAFISTQSLHSDMIVLWISCVNWFVSTLRWKGKEGIIENVSLPYRPQHLICLNHSFSW